MKITRSCWKQLRYWNRLCTRTITSSLDWRKSSFRGSWEILEKKQEFMKKCLLIFSFHLYYKLTSMSPWLEIFIHRFQEILLNPTASERKCLNMLQESFTSLTLKGLTGWTNCRELRMRNSNTTNLFSWNRKNMFLREGRIFLYTFQLKEVFQFATIW